MPEPRSLSWAVPQLLRALEVGHPSHRGRVLGLLARQDDAALSADPVRAVFVRLLSGEATALLRRVGEFVTGRGLTAYAPQVVALLARAPELREEVEGWLRRERMPRPKAELIAFAADSERPVEGRAAALRLLAGVELGFADRVALLPALARGELHPPALRLLRAAADEALVEAAIAANQRHGQAILRRDRQRRTGSPEPGWLEALFPARPSSLGEWAALRPSRPGGGALVAPQLDFVHGIAHLAIAARSRRWLTALHPHLFDEGLTRPLRAAYLELELTEVGAPLAGWPDAWRGTHRRAVLLDLLGRLGVRAAAPRMVGYLPAAGRQASEDEQAAIVALARLGERARIAALLDGALARARALLGQAPEGTPGHRSTLAAAFQAGAALEDERFAQVGLSLLQGSAEVDELTAVLPEVLVALGPLELVPAVQAILGDPSARDRAVEQALEVVRLSADAALIPQVVAVACRRRPVADAATRVVAGLLGAGDAAHARALLEQAAPGDAAARALLERAFATLAAEAARDLARAALERGAGGAKAQRLALGHLEAAEAGDAFLATCLGLLRSPHGRVRTAALREVLERGALRRDQAALASAGEALARDLLDLLGEALVAHEQDEQAKQQVTAVLNELVPKGGVADVLDTEQAGELRRRIRQLGLWSEQATFHAFHREALELAARGVDLGIVHGAALQLLATRPFRHPTAGVTGPYGGPLPRFSEAWASASPFVQEALFDLVCGAGYLRTDRLVAQFLGSPRAGVRARALGRLGREAALRHHQAVLGRLGDDAPEVRRAAVDLLREHHLERFAPRLAPLLEDADEGVRLQALRTLADWGDPGCLSELARFLASDDAALRREAARTLRRFEPALLVGLLSPLVDRARPRAAAAALAALRPDALPADEALGDAIFALAAGAAGPLRARALRFLPALADARRLGDCVPLLVDDHPEVRAAARHVLRRRDGRRHAPAIARQAVAAQGTVLRGELLGLLAELAVPEVARGLLPLLLDPDPEVRGAARAAVTAPRGYSLQADLAALLTEGLDGGASTGALDELVRLLHRVGDEQAFPALAQALRCEERPVWEAVCEAARARGADDHLERLVELLEAKPPHPPLAPPLLTLALAEVARTRAWERFGGLRDLVAELARAGASETVRRQALAVLAQVGDAGAVARELLKETAGRVAALEKAAAKEQQDLRAELARTRGTLTACARTLVGEASSGPALGEAAAALPAAALRARVPAEILWRAGAFKAADPAADVARALKALPAGAPGRLPPGRALAGMVRDRWSAAQFCEAYAGRDDAAPTDRWSAAFLAGRGVDLAECRKALDPARPDHRAIEGFLLAAMVQWRPELRPLLGEIAARGAEWVRGLQGWAQRREARERARRYARVMVRLGLDDGTDAVLELAAEGAHLGPCLLAALGDVARLKARLEADAGESRASARGDALTLLGEVGGAAAVEVLVDRAQSDFGEARLAAVAALGRAGEPAAARDALARLLLGSGEEDAPADVQIAALEAIARLGLSKLGPVVISALGSPSVGVQVAACQAVRRLGLASARRQLVLLLVGASRVRAAAAEALALLAQEGEVGDLLEALRGRVEREVAERVGDALARVAPAGRLDEVGALLGQAGPVGAAVALRVLGERGHQAALPAIRGLIAQGEGPLAAAACQAAAALGDPSALEELRPLAEGAVKAEGRVRAAAVSAVARLAEAPEARALVLRCLGAPSEQVELAALTAAAELLPDAELSARLLELVRAGLFPGVALPGEGEGLEALVERVRGKVSRRPERRAAVDAACSALVAGGDPGDLAQARALVWAGIEEPDMTHLSTLVAVVAGAAPDQVTSRLAAVFRSSPAWRRPTELLTLVSDLDPAAGAPLALLELESGRGARPAAARVLARAFAAGGAELEGELRELLLDADAEVRRAARAALQPERAPWLRDEEQA